MATLTDVSLGQSAVIVGIEGRHEQKLKFLDLGLTPGTVVKVRKIAPMGDPIEITLRSYVLTLRKDEAILVSVAPANETEAD